jgi:hypothetical protein
MQLPEKYKDKLPFVGKFVAGVWKIIWAFMIMWQKLNQSDAFSQNKVYTKNVNHIIEYINTIIQKTTTYTLYIYKSAYSNTMLLLFKVAPLTLYRCSYSGLDILC